MIIRIRPLDTFFFRDGKPFSRGQETWADGVFPPSPTILYGALRAIYFTHHPDEFEKANTSDDLTLNLKIKGVFLEIGEEIYLPVPADFVITKDEDEKKTSRLLTVVQDNNISSKKTRYITTVTTNETVENMESHSLFAKEDFQGYLNMVAVESLPYRTTKDYLQNEPKIAFKKNDATMTVDEESLHRVGTQRFKEDNGTVSIVVNFEDLEIPQQGLMKLGGEGKLASYETIELEDYTKIEPPVLEGNRFKICLATPALFKQGWLPSWIDEKTFEGEFNNLKLKLLTAIVGKPVLVGGFDMKENRPKPMYKAVPAGSVYYFELLEESRLEDAIKVFHQQAISETFDTSDLVNWNCTANQGFGITYVGKT